MKFIKEFMITDYEKNMSAEYNDLIHFYMRLD